MFDVSIVGCADYSDKNVNKALEELLSSLNFWELINPGMTVVIKANLVSFLKPDRAATTHPALLAELVRLLREKNVSVIIGDSPGGLYTLSNLNKVYSSTGMQETEKYGAELNRNFDISQASFPEGLVLKNFTYTSYLDKADMIINFCKLKTHGMMGMSSAVKNMFGCIPGVTKPEYHYRFPEYSDFADMLIDLNSYFKPGFNIVDAVECMEGNGPTSGTPRHIGAVIAGRNPSAVDLCCAEVIGLKANDVPTLSRAVHHSLIPDNLSELNVYGNPEDFKVNDFKNIAVRDRLKFGKDGKGVIRQIYSTVAEKALTAKPVLNPEECVGCNECGRLCPAKAIKIVNNKAKINRKTCIKCFCCQEFCPKGALKSKRTLIARVIEKIKI